MKIRLKLALLLSGALGILLPLLTYGYYRQVRQIFLQQVYQHLESISQTKAIRLRDMALKRYELIQLFSTNQVLVDFLRDRRPSQPSARDAALQTLFRRYLTQIRDFKHISLVSLQGVVLMSTSRSLIGQPLAGQHSFQDAQQGRASWGDFHLDAQGKLCTYLARPVYWENRPLAILLVETDAADVLSLTSDYTGLGRTGETVIGWRSNQTVLVNSLRFGKADTYLVPLDPADELLPMNRALQKRAGIVAHGLDYRGEAVIASVRYSEPLGWGLVTKIDEREAFAPINRLTNTLLLINLAGIATLFVLAYLASGYLAKPIEQLTRTVQRMRAGHLSERASIRSRDEVGQLARSYNQMADELERHITDLDSFVYAASHDLKAPVSNLEGFVTILQKKLADRLDGTERTLLTYLLHSITRLKKTIQDLTEIVKIQKEAEKQPEMVSIEEVYREVAGELATEINGSQARLQVDFQVGQLVYTRRYLRSILYHLLSNALKYRSPERTPLIVVHTRATPAGVELSVSDNGLGMAPQVLPKLFTMFKRFHSHVEGSGVGLFMIKRMVDNHGGKIEVESEEGKGSTFKVLFPEAT